MLCCVALCCAVLCCAVSCCVVLKCIILYCIAYSARSFVAARAKRNARNAKLLFAARSHARLKGEPAGRPD